MWGRTIAHAARAAAAALALSAATVAAETVPQDGPRAERIREVLRGIRLPDGFHVSLHAVVPDARHMAVAPAPGGVVFVGTGRDRLWAVLDRDGDGRAEEVRAFAPGLRFEMPNGACFAPDGTLFVPEINRVRAFRGAAERLGEEAPAAAARWCRRASSSPPRRRAPTTAPGCAGSGRTTGSTFARPALRRAAAGEAAAVRTARDRRHRPDGLRRAEPRGLRARDPEQRRDRLPPGTRELWFTDTDSNGLGDDLPPGEINRAAAPGLHFGFPWYGGGSVRTDEHLGSEPPADAVFPAVETAAHATDLGLAFYEGGMFPAEYRGALFSAQRGSAVRRAPVGARMMPPSWPRTARRAGTGPSPMVGWTGRRAATAAGSWTSPSCRTGRCWCPTTRRGRSTGSPTAGRAEGAPVLRPTPDSGTAGTGSRRDDIAKARLIAEAAKEVSQPDT